MKPRLVFKKSCKWTVAFAGGLTILVLSACASKPLADSAAANPPNQTQAPIQAETAPLPSSPDVIDEAQSFDLPPVTAPDPQPIVAQPPKPPAAQSASRFGDREGRLLLDQLLPRSISNRAGWSNDIFNAFKALKIPYTPEYFCAAIAVIEQESSWQADPVVPGLNKIVWKEIEKRAERYHVPMFMVEAALYKVSPTGKTYKERIDSLKTERQMNALFEDMVNEAPVISRQLGINNPIRTGGPMQVSIEFAKGHASAWPYPYSRPKTLRDEVFTRRGGVYFGIANLLHYPSGYPNMIYRFADFNAGRYSSRNAAFQAAVARLSEKKLALDGDLLIYESGRPSPRMSSTERALVTMSKRLGFTQPRIRRELMREKDPDFAQSELYRRVFNLADEKADAPMPRQRIPAIRLESPKIKRKLTTAWFADRVNTRYKRCLSRQIVAQPPLDL